MATMLAEVYDAFLEAGATQVKARAAAEAVAGYENRFSTLEQRMTKLEGKVDLLTWMIGAVFAMNVAILVRLLTLG